MLTNSPVKFDIDLEKLEQSFKGIQKKLHPDLFSHASTQEQDYSASQSAMANNAYQTLKNPQFRAEYMLKNIFKTDVEDYTLPQDFLIEMMDLMEQVSEDLPPDQLEKIQNQVNEQIEESCKALSKSFAKQDLETVKRQVAELNYLTRVKNQVIEQLP
jgi:molecular chaperone HscB